MRAAAAAFVLSAATLASSSAAADETPSWIVKEGPHPTTLALELNPLAIAVGRFSATIEYVLQTHHAVTASPHYYWAFPGPGGDSFDGGGIEVGYRYYSGRRGTNGVFVGVSFLFGDYRYIHNGNTFIAPDGKVYDPSSEADYQSFGGAIDAGYKLLVWDSFVVGAGAGAQVTYSTEDPQFQPASRGHESLLYGSGIRPRALLEFGAAF